MLFRESDGLSESRNPSWSIVIRRPRLSKAREAGRSPLEVVVVVVVVVETTGAVVIEFVEGVPLRQRPAFQNRVVPRQEPRASRPSGRNAIERVTASKPLRRVRTSGSTTAQAWVVAACPEETSVLPSGEKATSSTRSSDLRTATRLCDSVSQSSISRPTSPPTTARNEPLGLKRKNLTALCLGSR